MGNQKIQEIISFSKDKYELTIFKADTLNRVEARLAERLSGKKKKVYKINCFIRGKEVELGPEEVIRQCILDQLIVEYGYWKDYLRVEYPIHFGREKKKADIVILNWKDKTSVYCVVEVKKYKARDGKEQLKSYTNATGAPLAIWTNGLQMECYERLDPNYFEPLSGIPKAGQTIEDFKGDRFTYLDLMKKDRLSKERKSLKTLIEDMEDEVLANAGVDSFEEVFKLIFTKLYDEMESSDDRIKIEIQLKQIKKHKPGLSFEGLLKEVDSEEFRECEFRSLADVYQTQKRIQELFKKAKEKWSGIFEREEPLKITDRNHLKICVGFLQDVKLFNSNLQVIDEAFEYLVNKSAKGEKGQYFTPRNVIDMCVSMLNPKLDETMIDTACGSCGFTVHTLFYGWKKLESRGEANFRNFSNQKLTRQQKDYVNKVFGIDFDERSVRVARTLNLIAGDGNTNVLHLNSLDYESWQEKSERDEAWKRTYLPGYYRMLDLAVDREDLKKFKFDLLMANPPFAGDIKDKRLTANYQLAFNKDKKQVDKISRDILFIERDLDFLKPGGRMAIVLPQGRFNNTNDERVRDFVLERARILAVVGLDVNTFKPHTGTKTSVLFVQKWDENKDSRSYNPEVEDYPIFMAVSSISGKDNSGEVIYEKDEQGRVKLDKHGHLIQKHDLNEIAAAFIEWAKKEGLSFWRGEF